MLRRSDRLILLKQLLDSNSAATKEIERLRFQIETLEKEKEELKQDADDMQEELDERDQVERKLNVEISILKRANKRCAIIILQHEENKRAKQQGIQEIGEAKGHVPSSCL